MTSIGVKLNVGQPCLQGEVERDEMEEANSVIIINDKNGKHKDGYRVILDNSFCFS